MSTKVFRSSSNEVYAADPTAFPRFGPPPTPWYPFPCNAIAPPGSNPYGYGVPPHDVEFHSLRPYQKSPCNEAVSPVAIFCGPNLLYDDSMRITFVQPGRPDDLSGNLVGDNHDCNLHAADFPSSAPRNTCYFHCNPNDFTTPREDLPCDYRVYRDEDVFVDISDAQLPIMGNTEQVVNNYRPQADNFDDSVKVNDYTSWYLNGVTDRAEYSYPDIDKNCIGNSGRAGICLPSSLGVCWETIWDSVGLIKAPSLDLHPDGSNICAGVNNTCCTPNSGPQVTYLDRDRVINYSGPIKKSLSMESQQRLRIDEADDLMNSTDDTSPLQVPNIPEDAEGRHNQVVACHKGFTVSLPLWTINIGPQIPVPCPNTPTSYNGTAERLNAWLDQNRMPPMPEDPQYYDNGKFIFLRFWEAYREWRGQFCTTVVVPGIWKRVLLCFNVDTPAGGISSEPLFYPQLFPYIPFSSTEDRKGEFDNSVPVFQSSASITDIAILNKKTAELFFSHMQESVELAKILQDTFAYGEGVEYNRSTKTWDKTYEAAEQDGSPTQEVTQVIPPYCKIKELRTNVGDNLFAGELAFKLKYNVNFTCHWEIYDQSTMDAYPCDQYGKTCYNPDYINCSGSEGVGVAGCPADWTCANSCSLPVQYCDQYVSVTIPTLTRSPLVNQAWRRLVAGPAAIFKRWMPRPGDDNPIKYIMDIPAYDPVTIYSVLLKNPDHEVYPLTRKNAADPARSPDELYFPHIGGIHQYLLRCLQTIIRPQGFAEACPQGYKFGDGMTYDCSEFDAEPQGATASGGCAVQTSGHCSWTNICAVAHSAGYGLTDQQCQIASALCSRESGGDPAAFNCGCLEGKSLDFSVGLFQFNCLAWDDQVGYPNAFLGEGEGYSFGPPPWCVVNNKEDAQGCINELSDPVKNITLMARYVSATGDFCPWKTRAGCAGFPGYDAECW